MKKHIALLPLLVLFGTACSTTTTTEDVVGTYDQEAPIAGNSPLKSSIKLNSDMTFEMSGFVNMKGAYELNGSQLRFIPVGTNTNASIHQGLLTATLQNGVIEMPEISPSSPPVRFKKQ